MSSPLSRRRVVSGLLAAACSPFLIPTPGPGAIATFAATPIPCGPGKPENPGLLSPTSYKSPSFGNAVTWDDNWEVAATSNPAAVAVLGTNTHFKPVDCGIGNGGSDSLLLSHRHIPTSVFRIEIFERGLWTFDTMLDAMNQPGWLNNLHLPEGSEALLTDHTADSLAMIARDGGNTDHVVYAESLFPPENDAVIISVTLHLSSRKDYPQTLNDAGSVDIEGFTLYSTIAPEKILSTIDPCGCGR